MTTVGWKVEDVFRGTQVSSCQPSSSAQLRSGRPLSYSETCDTTREPVHETQSQKGGELSVGYEASP